jgi:ribonuclease HI
MGASCKEEEIFEVGSDGDRKFPTSHKKRETWGTPPPLEQLMSELVAYVDGGCLGNPGPSGIGVVISGCASGPVRIAKSIGRQDNNVAEYAALMEALQYAVALKAQKLHVFSDSEVVVRQMTGEYTCRSPRLYSLHWTCRKLARSLKFSISHVPREDNAEANGLAQSALRRRVV